MRRSGAVPWLLFLILAGVLVGAWWLVQARERRALQARLDTAAHQVSSRLEHYFARHIDRIGLVARDLLGDEVDEGTFRGTSADYQRTHPGLQALNWVGADGTITWVEPEEPNLPALGFDLDEHPIASGAFRRAAETGEAAVTPPLELLQGGWGIAAYYPVTRSGERLGYLNAVFRLPDLLADCLRSPEDAELAYVLRHGDDLLGVLGPADRSNGLPLASAPVRVGDRNLALTVIAAPAMVAAEATWVDEALLAAGLALAALLAWQLGGAVGRREKAELLAERFRTLLENAPDAIAALDANTGTLINGNERAYRMVAAPEDFLGTHLADLAPDVQPGGESSRALFDRHLEAARNGKHEAFEWIFTDRAGEERTTEVHLVRMPNPGRELVRASILDISDRKRLERRLRRARAHEAMGTLAGGVAHDFNNLLTSILGSAEMLELGASDETARAHARNVIDTATRAARLTQQLLAFSRHSVLRPEPIDPGSLVRNLVPMLDRLMPEGVRIETGLSCRRAFVADRSQVELALLNLVVNARDAMPDGGTIRVYAKDTVDGGVSISVEDEGGGVPGSFVDRIFEPFFTTKDPDVGTGIGLAATKEVVEQAGGKISVGMAPTGGARFELVFPATDLPAAEPAPVAREEAPSESGTVLVVEDDAAVLSVLEQSLSEAGYRVLAAESAEAALEQARGLDRPIDVLVTDAMLPGIDGMDLIRALRRERPETAAVLMSGYAAKALSLQEDMADVAWLPKPFLPSVLVEQVQAARTTKPPIH